MPHNNFSHFVRFVLLAMIFAMVLVAYPHADSVNASTSTTSGAPKLAAPEQASGLWVSTYEAVLAPGADGLTGGWTESQVLEFDGPTLSLGDTTDGELGIITDLSTFTVDPANTDALHIVSRTLTVGSGGNTFDLQPGDLLLTFGDPEVILAAYCWPG